MRVTVAICTWNRAELLDQTLQQMQRLRIPDRVDWELLVVNNNCTDKTDEVIGCHAGTLPLQRLLERKQGHSHARNCAVAAATGELLLWTDDDVLVDSEWLAAYVDAAQRQPEVTLFGGPIEPWFERTPPRWVMENLGALDGPFVIRGASALEKAIGVQNPPFGANMAYRTSVLRQFPFDTKLGRRGKAMLGGDDTDMVQRVLAAGYKASWVPGAVVQHFVIADRMTPRYLYRFFHGMRQTISLQTGEMAGAEFPRWLVRRWLGAMSRRIASGLLRRRDWLLHLRTAAEAHGMFSAWWVARRSPVRRVVTTASSSVRSV
jgi:glycosyltransferase involved in cell wall biosynthesis